MRLLTVLSSMDCILRYVRTYIRSRSLKSLVILSSLLISMCYLIHNLCYDMLVHVSVVEGYDMYACVIIVCTYVMYI